MVERRAEWVWNVVLALLAIAVFGGGICAVLGAVTLMGGGVR